MNMVLHSLMNFALIMAGKHIETMKTYSDLILLPTFEERYEYLKLSGGVGLETFGSNRYLNQIFYQTPEWKRVRRDVIARDGGCDLAHQDRPINTKIYVHHINPITVDDILKRRDCLFDMENLISISFNTHNAVHYGDSSLLIPSMPIERHSGDQIPWR